MDNNNGNPSQGGEPAMEAEDWRSQLKAESRQRIVNKIMVQQHQSSLLLTQGHQSQPQASQQQLLSQIQSQPAQMQQQMSMQQQSNPLQRDMQQRIQAAGQVSGSMLQPPNVMEQQKQLYLAQRALPETSSTSLDSTAQTGHTNGADWQEEVYQKIKVMKEMYFPELSEMYQKIAGKLHQHDSLPQQPKSDQLEKLKMFKSMLERLITILQLPKSNISLAVKEKLPAYEKQIVNFINTNRPRKPVPSLQPGHPLPHMQSMQQSQSQITQLQSHENQMNPQLQSMNLQGSVPTMQQNNMTGLQQNCMSSLSEVSTAQQNMMNPLQPSSNMDPGQGTSLNSVQQQVPVGSIQQTSVSAPQQANMNALSSQNGINMLQNNINPLQSNPGILHSQHLKQQEQQLYQNQLKQQYQQRQMQQQLMQKQQIIQQQQQLQQQAKQQLPGQLQAHQMPQLHQISDANDVKIRPGMGVKPGNFQQHMSVSQRAYPHSQLKSASPYSVASNNPLLQAQSPQLSQHSSPQVDQQLLVPKAGTPLQNTSSPFVIPSPSTPVAPSPMPGDSEKPSSLSNAGNVGHQPTAGVGAQVQFVMQPQVTNQGQLSSENIESNIPPAGVQFSAGLSSAQAPTPALNMSSLVSALPPSPGSGFRVINPLPSNAGVLHNRYLLQQELLRLMNLESQQRQLQEQLSRKNQNQTFQQKQQQEIQRLLLTSALSSSQSESNMLQGSDSLDSSSGKVAKQHQKQELEGKVVQNQLKQQPFQQLQMQQQWTQKPHMLQEKQQQQIQQLQQQTKQQLHHIYFIYLIFLAILLGAYLFRTGY